MRRLPRRDCSWRSPSVTCCLIIKLSLFGLMLVLAAGSALAQSNVVTYHYDNSRSGLNASEVILTPSNVNPTQFGRLFSFSVVGSIYAQPLYLPNLTIPGKGAHNVVFVATESDNVYAFDADSNSGANANPLWSVSLIDAAHGAASGATPMASSKIGCNDISPNYGITSTPVIDSVHGTIYLVAVSTENGNVITRLHALDITTGAEKTPGPTQISATITGTGDGSSGGQLSFVSADEMNRAGLLLLNGNVYVGFAGHCDKSPWHGWLFAYDALGLNQTAVYNSTPNGGMGGIWMSGGGIAADSDSIYFSTGNGTYDGVTAFSDSVLKLGQPSSGTLPVSDWFTPWDQVSLNTNDLDVSSSGVLLLPDQPAGSAHVHLIVTAGKDGTIYVIDRDTGKMGHINSSSDSQIVQSLPGALAGIWGMPAWWNNNIYFGGTQSEGLGGDTLKAFHFDPSTGMLSTPPGSQSVEIFKNTGITPVVSANGTTSGIVWALQVDQWQTNGPGVLHAYDATDLSIELYNSTQNASRDNPGPAVKFAVPIVINGKTYVGTQTELSVFGELSLLAGVGINPGSVVGGDSSMGTVTLGTAAPAGSGIVVTLSSNNPAVAAVPASVTVPAGATSVTFSVTTTAVNSNTPVVITASYAGAPQVTTLTVEPLLSSLAINPSMVAGGSGSTGTVQLNAPAPADGLTVILSNTNAAVVTAPPSVAVPAGATTASFPITTNAVDGTSTSTITATYDNSPTAILTINPAATAVLSIALSPASVIGGVANSTATVTLNGSMPSGGGALTLLSGTPDAAAVPASMIVAEGATTGTFLVTTNAVATTMTSSISATYNNTTQSATLTVNPVPQPPQVSFVRAAGGSKDSAAYTVAISPTAGDFLGVFVWSATTPTVTDNLGSTYTRDCTIAFAQGGVSQQLTVFHLLNAPSGITGITTSSQPWSHMIVAEYSGMPTSGTVLDVCGTAKTQTTASTSWSSTATNHHGEGLGLRLGGHGIFQRCGLQSQRSLDRANRTGRFGGCGRQLSGRSDQRRGRELHGDGNHHRIGAGIPGSGRVQGRYRTDCTRQSRAQTIRRLLSDRRGRSP